MTSAANQNIAYTLTPDLNNRLASVLDSNGKAIGYQYNSLNQRTRMVADGRTIDYTYDNGNRLYQVLSPGPVATITYDLAGRRQTLGYPNLVTTTYTPNKAGFLTNLLTRYNQLTTINSFAYTPDGLGNRVDMTDLAGQHVYTYDNTYQLTQATHPNMPIEQFTYDPVGNRLTSEGQAPSLGRSTEYVYDFENRLTEVDYFGTLGQYKYDPFGRRIEKNANGAITRYVYDGPNIVNQYDQNWNVQAKYTHTLDIDDPLAVEQGANTFYYHKDGLGSVVNLTDASGNAVKSYTYKSFGEIYQENGTLVQPFTFTGREYDPESGLYFYRARYYDPRAGRFLTKDPIGFAGGDVNLYRYVSNNPINGKDPNGLIAPVIVGVGLAVGQLALETGVFYSITRDISCALLATGYWQAVKLGAMGVIGGIVTTAVGIGVASPLAVGVGAGEIVVGSALIRSGLSKISEIQDVCKEKDACSNNRK